MLEGKREGSAVLGHASRRHQLRACPGLQPPRLWASVGRAARTGQRPGSNPGTDSNSLLPGCRTSLPRPARTGTRCARLRARQLRAPRPRRASFRDLRAGCCAGGKGRRTETGAVQQAAGRGGASCAPGHAPCASRGPRGLGTGGKAAPSASGALVGGLLVGASPQGLCWLRLQYLGAFLPCHEVSRARPSRADAVAGNLHHLGQRAAYTVAKTPGVASRARFLRGHGWVLVWERDKARPQGRTGL